MRNQKTCKKLQVVKKYPLGQNNPYGLKATNFEEQNQNILMYICTVFFITFHCS